MFVSDLMYVIGLNLWLNILKMQLKKIVAAMFTDNAHLTVKGNDTLKP